MITKRTKKSKKTRVVLIYKLVVPKDKFLRRIMRSRVRGGANVMRNKAVKNDEN